MYFRQILGSSATISFGFFFPNYQLQQTRVNRIILSLYLSYTEQSYLFPRQNQASFPSFNDSLTHELIYMTKKKEKEMLLKVSHALRTPGRLKKMKEGGEIGCLG